MSEKQTQEEFLKDLENLKEDYNKSQYVGKDVKVPHSIQAFRKRSEELEKHRSPDIDESKTYVISGRGKGIKSRLVEPGKSVPYCKHDDIEIRKKIREVSGIGYRNEIIEQTIAASTKELEEDYESPIKFVKVANNGKVPAGEIDLTTTP